MRDDSISIDPARLENVKHLDGGAIRAACPACRAAGSDKSGDHLLIQPGGKFGCATNPGDGEHRKEIFRLAGVHTSPTPATNGHNGSPAKSNPAFNWQECVDAFTDDHAQRLAEWRGLSIEFVRWLHAEKVIGIFENKFAFANHGGGGNVVSCHVRLESGKWIFKPSGQKTAPLIFGDTKAAGFILAFESQWDAFAVMDKRGWHMVNGLPDAAVFITRGAGNGELIAGRLSPDAVCYAFKQNDPPTTKKPISAGDEWLAKIASNAGCNVLNVATPEPHKDVNDWTKAGATADDLQAAINIARAVQTPAAPELTAVDTSESKQRILTLRSPDELLAMTFDDSDVILGDRLLAKGQPLVIAAQGGTGKSRLALQIVAAIVTERKCLAFDTGVSEMRWLILQTENSNRRLQQDLARIKTWLGGDWPRFAEQVVFHTVENDDDGFVSLDSPENQIAIQKAIESANPDGIVIDPLNDFAAGDLNKDADMRMTLQSLSRLCRRGNPDRAIVVLHHSLTGKAGAARATGHDRASFARNSKTLHAWTRGQINLAPVDPDNNDRLIVACGKCSNGREFQTFAVRLNPDTMIYECDPSIDVSAWQSEMTGKAESPDLSPDMVAGAVAELCKAGDAPKKPQIVKALRDETGCATGSAYRAIERAEHAKKIHYTKATKTYVTN